MVYVLIANQYNDENFAHTSHIAFFVQRTPSRSELFGSDITSFCNAQQNSSKKNTKTDIVDIVMAALSTKSWNEVGAMAWVDPDKIYSIITKVHPSWYPTYWCQNARLSPSIPSCENARRWGCRCLLLAMYGRTREQMYIGFHNGGPSLKVAQALTNHYQAISNPLSKKPNNASKKSVLMPLWLVAAMGNPYPLQPNHYWNWRNPSSWFGSFKDKMNIAYYGLNANQPQRRKVAVRDLWTSSSLPPVKHLAWLNPRGAISKRHTRDKVINYFRMLSLDKA